MLVSFTLSMPGNNAWNNRWSGEDRSYVIIKSFKGKKREAKIQSLIDTGYFSYDFGDGWRAGVSLQQVDAALARKLRKQSAGFCGYDWMIDSILMHGEIRSSKH
jgi:hypothetical protein